MKINIAVFLSILILGSASSKSNFRVKFGGKPKEDKRHKMKDNLYNTKSDSTLLYTGWYYISEINNGFKRQLDKSIDTFFINPKPIVVAKNFTSLEIYETIIEGQKLFGLIIRLDDVGREIWSDATKKSIGKQLAFILNNRLLHIATINSQITAGITSLNREDYSKAEFENIKMTIENEK